MSFLRNCWYVAAWSDEVPAGGMFPRTLLGELVLLVRDDAGTPSALLDRCPHRFAPLSVGSAANGVVTCGYHGLAFDGSGKCVTNPHGPIVSAQWVPSWPVRDAHKALWIWMGDPALADPALIPDISYLEAVPDSAFSKGYLASYGHYQLYVDNILDLSHTDYVHPTTLGGGAMTRATAQVKQDGDRVSVAWLGFNEQASPMIDSLLPEPGKPADIWAEVDWQAPGIMTLVNGGTPAGQPREVGVASRNLHALTPETDSTSHYFFAATRTFRLEDQALNDMIAERREWIFANEDKPMIEAQQRRIGDADFWSLKPVIMKTDHAAVVVRRLMDKLIANEGEVTA